MRKRKIRKVIVSTPFRIPKRIPKRYCFNFDILEKEKPKDRLGKGRVCLDIETQRNKQVSIVEAKEKCRPWIDKNYEGKEKRKVEESCVRVMTGKATQKDELLLKREGLLGKCKANI